MKLKVLGSLLVGISVLFEIYYISDGCLLGV